MLNIAVIGAGLAGTTVARQLESFADVSVFEKARGAGGRLSTRRVKGYTFDHGAQFFKMRSPAFKSAMIPLVNAGIIANWDARIVDINPQALNTDQQPYYVGVPGMSAIVRYLSKDLNVIFSTRIEKIIKEDNKWNLYSQDGKIAKAFDWVILSIPAQQAYTLLPKTTRFSQSIADINMQSCFALLYGFKPSPTFSFDALRIANHPIRWIGLNHSKPGRNEHGSIVVHSNNDWADQHINDNKNTVFDYLTDQASKVLEYDLLKADYCTIHQWRYANINHQHGWTYYADVNDGIGVCGDWLIQGNVEAAFTSGLKLAQHIIEALNNKT